MPQRSGLGKGLDALIPGGSSQPASSGFVSSTGGVTEVSLDLIQRNPRQPRLNFHESELQDLAASIREHGVIQPLIVSKASGNTYVLVAGERRLQAARKAGLQTVPVVIRQASDQQFL